MGRWNRSHLANHLGGVGVKKSLVGTAHLNGKQEIVHEGRGHGGRADVQQVAWGSEDQRY
jgi:hypothetical protein